MKRQHTHADGALLLRGHFPERPDIELGAEIELSSSVVQLLHNDLAFSFMLLAMCFLTFLVAIPNALAPVALLGGITLLSARRAEFGGGLWGLILLVVRLNFFLLLLVAAAGHGGRDAGRADCS